MVKVTLKNTSFASKRAQVLQECNAKKKIYSGTELNTTAVVEEGPKEEFPESCKTFKQEELDVGIFKKRGGELLPKVMRKNDSKKRNVTFWLPPMKVKYSDLGKNGNLGKFTEDPSKAKFTVTLVPGGPKDEEAFVKQGEEALEFVSEWANKCMGAAYHDEDTWKALSSKHEDDTSFINGAQHSVLKTLDDDQEVIQLNRRLEGWSGEPNRPVFWRLKEDNTYEQIDPKYIKKDSILSVQMSFRAYKIPGGRYGMAGDLGKHILVVYSPPDNQKPKIQATPFNVPYIPFDV